MLRCFFNLASRWPGPPGSPNSRSKTARGLVSMGNGVLGVLHEIVFIYAQLNPGEQPPTYPVKSSVAISSDGNGVSCPICCATTWSMVVLAWTSSASVRFGQTPVENPAQLTA